MEYETRYELKVGKFGTYFYDKKLMVDLTNEDVLRKLNRNDYLQKEVSETQDLMASRSGKE